MSSRYVTKLTPTEGKAPPSYVPRRIHGPRILSREYVNLFLACLPLQKFRKPLTTSRKPPHTRWERDVLIMKGNLAPAGPRDATSDLIIMKLFSIAQSARLDLAISPISLLRSEVLTSDEPINWLWESRYNTLSKSILCIKSASSSASTSNIRRIHKRPICRPLFLPFKLPPLSVSFTRLCRKWKSREPDTWRP